MIGVSILGLIAAVVLVRENSPTRVIIRSLRQGDDAARRAAALDLSSPDTVDVGLAIPAVANAMIRDPSVEVRSEAARTMGTLGAESIKRQEPALRDQALGAVLAGFDDKDPVVRAVVVSVIANFAGAATNLSKNDYDLRPVGAPMTVVAKLLPLLKDPDATVRKNAISALGYFPSELSPSLPMLLKAAAEEPGGAGGRARGAMAGLLRKVRPLKPEIPGLIEAIKSEDPKVSFQAIVTIGQAQGDGVDAIPVLLAILKDPAGADETNDPGRAAATALGQVGPDSPQQAEIVAALNAAKDSGPKSRERAIDSALKEFAPAAP